MARKHTPSSLVRPLGALEEMFAVYSEEGYMTFCIAARVHGRLSSERLEHGLVAVQHRHPKLTFAIGQHSNGHRFFAHSDKSVSFRLLSVGSDAAAWEKIVMQELATPFAAEEGGLFRLTALAGTENVLVLTFHHAIADGLSGITVLRDLLLAMSGQKLEVGQVWDETIEDLLGEDLTACVAENASWPSFPPVRNEWTAKANRAPLVHSWVISSEETTEIIAKAKREQTTVHGALLTALVRARHEQAPDAYPADGLRVMSPINVRPFTPPSPQVGVFISSTITSMPSPGASSCQFWDEARIVSLEIASKRSLHSTLDLTLAVELQMRQDPSTAAVTESMRLLMDHDALLSNLGRLDLDARYGEFEIMALWGPAQWTCNGGDTIGAVTFAGKLHLVHTALDNVSLLERIVDVLREVTLC